MPLLALKWRIKVRIAVCGAIVFGAVTGFIVNWIDTSTAGLHVIVLLIIEYCILLFFMAVSILLRFYRDPERTPPETENVILAPADGTVVYVNSVEKGSTLVSTKGKKKFKLTDLISTNLFADATYLVGIDMNILNVHVNRTPIAGGIIICKRTRGKFISLRREESDLVNERVTTVIDNGRFKIGVVQISSRLVRKIVSYIKEGDRLDIGQRLGSIIFGSQVDVVIPDLENLKVTVKPGDEVKAGVTVVARY